LPVVVRLDAKGIKKVIEYRIGGEGNKVTTTKRVRMVRRSKSTIQFRSWPKFDGASKEAAGSRLTMVSEILFDCPRGCCIRSVRPRSGPPPIFPPPLPTSVPSVSFSFSDPPLTAHECDETTIQSPGT
ncbi:hypothetical protein BAE44_0008125, partial [Dichanthelium oligosanthes]